MKRISNLLIAFVAIEHILFLIMEMFLWQTPFVIQRFNMTEQIAKDSALLAMNQGLYNGFLAAGLIWSLLIRSYVEQAFKIKLFFLSCVVIAGIFGALTVKISILVIQALPALIGLVVVYLSKPQENYDVVI
ncbi:MAG: DUF1304 domain-containing protein [Leptospiraceae bacterium]|nr:DUF1304 domain-containing protein [Leptospiraceae bacterium]MCP5496772.1 DUF1304 domain-containing protein [Leptospiraceae bacterium]